MQLKKDKMKVDDGSTESNESTSIIVIQLLEVCCFYKAVYSTSIKRVLNKLRKIIINRIARCNLVLRFHYSS